MWYGVVRVYWRYALDPRTGSEVCRGVPDLLCMVGISVLRRPRRTQWQNRLILARLKDRRCCNRRLPENPVELRNH